MRARSGSGRGFKSLRARHNIGYRRSDVLIEDKVFLTDCSCLEWSLSIQGSVKRKRKRGTGQPACTKHGPYCGPYCPQCYEKAIGGTGGDRRNCWWMDGVEGGKWLGR